MSKPKSITDFEELYNITLKKADSIEYIIRNRRYSNYYLVNETNEIIGLNLSENSFTVIPDLAPFPRLELLNLSENELVDISGLEGLKELKRLYLEKNHIRDIKGFRHSNAIEAVDLSNNDIEKIQGLEGLNQLKSLDLSYNKIEKIEQISHLKQLTYLRFVSNEIREIEGLEGLENLTSLNLAHNQLTEIKGLESLKELTELDVSYNEITEIKGLEQSEKLTEINFSYNAITEIKGLEQLKRLTELDLFHNKITEIKGLEQATDLSHLDIYSNEITEIKGLECLTQLTRLSLASNQITEIKGLDGLTKLTSLSLGNNQIEEIKGLAQLTQLKTLSLSSNRISEIKELESLQKLTELDFYNNQITEIKGLDGLKKIKELNLGNNQITEIKGLSQLKKLRSLNLGINNISKIKGLKNLKKLTELQLYKNRIKKIRGLLTLKKLESLDISHNQITNAEDFDQLDELEYLSDLDFSDNPLSGGEETKLYISQEKTDWEAFPNMEDYLEEAGNFQNKLLPLVRIDGGTIKDKWRNIPFIFMTHDISESQIDFRIEEGKYRVIQPEDLEDCDELEDIEVENNYLHSSPISREELTHEKTEVFDSEGRLVAVKENRLNTPSREIFNYGDYSLPISYTEQLLTGPDTWQDLNLRYFEYDADGFLIKDIQERLEQDIIITENLVYTSTEEGFVIDKQKGSYFQFQNGEHYKTRALGEVFPVSYKETSETWTFEKANDSRWSYLKNGQTNFDLKAVVLKLAVEEFCQNYSSFLRFEAVEDTLHPGFTNPEQEWPESVQFKVRSSAKYSETLFSYSEKTPTKVTVVTDYNTTKFEHLGNTIQVERTSKDRTQTLELDGRLTLQQAVISAGIAHNLWNFDFESPRNEAFHARPSFHIGTAPYAFQYKKTNEGLERLLISVSKETDSSVGSISLGRPQWLQDDETPLDPDGKRMEFVGQLDHQDLFGSLYLFYSAEHQLVSQVFQCT